MYRHQGVSLILSVTVARGWGNT